MQTRPLHMVMAKGPNLKPLYAHCLGGGPKPRITVTTHPAADGQWVWYLGGDLAEADGVAREPAAQIAAAQKEIASLLPWVDQSQVRWATLRVDRAEPCTVRPGTPGQRLPRRAAAPAGGLADQTGAGTGLQPTGSSATWSATASAHRRMPTWPTCPPATGRTGLGATAAMSLPTLHDLHRPLGSTGLLVSPLGLGTVKLAATRREIPQWFHHPGDDEARLLLAQARELGINLIDTAPAYGRSEERLGPLLRGQRDEWVIVSKVGEEFDDGQSHFDFSAAHTRRSVERSLRAWKPTASNWCWCIPTATTWRSSNSKRSTRPWPHSSRRARFSASACPAKPSPAA
jgi:hypothetical protein